MIRTANPTLNEQVFRSSHLGTGQAVMTIDGTVNKTIFCLLIAMATGYWAWSNPMTTLGVVQWTAFIGAFVVGIVTRFKPQLAPISGPVYSALIGVALGAFSWTLSAYLSSNPQAVMSGQVAPDTGLVFQAISLTFLTLFCMLMTYKSGFIKVTGTFRKVVIIGTATIIFAHLISLVLYFFGFRVDFLYGSGMFSIGFSLLAIGFASLNLVLDFDWIQTATQSGSAPKHMEWYGAFALLVTLVWLYIEILHLLYKLQSRD